MRYLWLVLLLAGCMSPGTDSLPGSGTSTPPTADVVSWATTQDFSAAAILYEFTPNKAASCTIHLNMTMHLMGADPQTWSVFWTGPFTISTAGTNEPVSHAYAQGVLDIRPKGEGAWIAHTSKLTLDEAVDPVRILRVASHVAPAPEEMAVHGSGDPSQSMALASDCGGQGQLRVEMAKDPIFLSIHNVDGAAGAGVGGAGVALDGKRACACPEPGRAFVGQHGVSIGTIKLQGTETWEWNALGSGMVTEYSGASGPFTATVDVATEQGIFVVVGGFGSLDVGA